MELEIKIGEEFRSDLVVKNEHTASAMGSGGLEVLSTPYMIALIENAAYNLLRQDPYNYDSVGILVDVAHTRACKIGTEIWATAKIKDVEGKKVTFEVKAFDAKGEIGYGRHVRYVIDTEKFLSKL